MADSWRITTISIALIFFITITNSLAPRETPELEQNLRDMCSQTRKPKQCWRIIKSHFTRFDGADSRGVAGVVIDLARAKAGEIHDNLNRLYEDSRDVKLKEKYLSCSKNYNDADRNLLVAGRNLDSSEYRNIPVQVDDTLEELKNCGREFGKKSFDPAHIRNRNKEFRVYVDIVKVAAERLMKEKHRN